MNKPKIIDGKKFITVESHTMGEPTRIILEGFPELKGNTMMERKKYLEENFDNYRKAVMLEPRGHRDMFGAIITEPINEEADLGVIFMDSGGYLNMCGHGSIGTSTVAVETGLVKVTEPYTKVVLETPAGIIRAKVKVKNGKALEVSIVNVPAFLYKKNLSINLLDYGKVEFDIAFGGSFFALVDSRKIGIEINNGNVNKLTDFGMKLREKINNTIQIEHPYLDITTVDLVEIYGPSDTEEADLKNIVIFGDSQVDRSPCGTGTSAKVATLYAKGKIGLKEEFVYESITGSKFKGIALKEMDINGMKAVIPEITGSAYITGYSQWVIDETDPLAYGFLMGKQKDKKVESPRSHIIQSAWNLFAQKDYEEIEIADIISASGLPKQEFSRYFTSKEELLYTMSELFDARYSELMVELDPDQSCFDKLLLLNRELFMMIEKKIPINILAYLYSAQMIASGDRHLLDRNRLYYKVVSKIMQQGLEKGEFSSSQDVETLVSAYAMLERGLLGDWCISHKQNELTCNAKKIMPAMLSGLLLRQ